MSEIATRYRDRVAQLRTGGYESAAQYLEWLFDDIEKLTAEDLERLPLTDTDEQLATWTEEERAQVLALINGVSQAKTERDVFPAIRDREEIGTSTKIPQRGITAKTQSLRAAILREFEHTGKPVTVRQMFYRCSVAGAVEKEETGYRRVQRQLLAMRREGLIPYDWISDNTRWMPRAYRSMVL